MTNLRLLPLALAAALSLPALAQTPPFYVQLVTTQQTPTYDANGNLTFAPYYINYSQIWDVAGLDVARLLAGPAFSVPMSDRKPIAFTADWQGEAYLANLVPVAPATPTSFTVYIWDNGNISHYPQVELDNATFDRWSLDVDNGIEAIETAQFRAGTKTVSLTAPAPAPAPTPAPVAGAD